jgi:hypothetical protein
MIRQREVSSPVPSYLTHAVHMLTLSQSAARALPERVMLLTVNDCIYIGQRSYSFYPRCPVVQRKSLQGRTVLIVQRHWIVARAIVDQFDLKSCQQRMLGRR